MFPLLLVLAITLVVIVLVAWLVAERRRSEALRTRFGPEYDRTMKATGSRRAAEQDLTARASRVQAMQIRHLDPAERDGFASSWVASRPASSTRRRRPSPTPTDWSGR